MPLSRTLRKRFKFISTAVQEEFRRSKFWYKTAGIVAALWFVLSVLGQFGVTLPVPPLSWRTATLFSLILAAALIMVVEAVYRFHQRAVSNIYSDCLVAVRRVLNLAQVVGQGSQIARQYYDKEDDAPREIFRDWVGHLESALSDSFGPNAVSEFTDGHPETLNVPDQRHVWFLMLRQRLSELVGRQESSIKDARRNHERLHS
jgi:hypothetical protein